MMKQTLVTAFALIAGNTALAAPTQYNYRIIHCDNQVNVFAAGGPVDGMKVVIEFTDENGAPRKERGRISIKGDASIVATSKSAYVYGELQGNGYFILKPAHDPYPGHCVSVPPAP